MLYLFSYGYYLTENPLSNFFLSAKCRTHVNVVAHRYYRFVCLLKTNNSSNKRKLANCNIVVFVFILYII